MRYAAQRTLGDFELVVNLANYANIDLRTTCSKCNTLCRRAPVRTSMRQAQKTTYLERQLVLFVHDRARLLCGRLDARHAARNLASQYCGKLRRRIVRLRQHHEPCALHVW
jgi:hypothetical protein